MEHPVDQLHLYVRILFGGRIEGSFRILGLWGQAVYILYGLAQILPKSQSETLNFGNMDRIDKRPLTQL